MESSVLIKAFTMLEVLADAPAGGLVLGDAAAHARVSKPTAHRVLQSLISLGYVAQDPGDGLYRLTGKLRQIGLGPADRWLVAAAAKAVRSLHDQTGETVNLGVLRQGRVQYLSVLESTQALRRVVAVQESDPFFCTAMGRAIVAYESPAVRDFLLRHVPPERRTPLTIVDPHELRHILDQARAQGYAVEQDQTDLGVTCVAAPILKHGHVLAAVSISVPTARFAAGDQNHFIQAVRHAARQIADEIIDGIFISKQGSFDHDPRQFRPFDAPDARSDSPDALLGRRG